MDGTDVTESLTTVYERLLQTDSPRALLVVASRYAALLYKARHGAWPPRTWSAQDPRSVGEVNGFPVADLDLVDEGIRRAASKVIGLQSPADARFSLLPVVKTLENMKMVSRPKIERPLSEEQWRVIDLINAGKNVFLTGVAGTGKSYLLNAWLSAKWRGDVALTASTGIAATHINGRTVHSWCGCGIGNKEAETISYGHKWHEETRLRIAATKVLVLDEIGMIDGATFELIEKLCRIARERMTEPFGGLQVILVGDMGQLAPVEDQNCFAFESPVWWEANLHMIELKEVHRQEEKVFVDLLRKIRMGQIDQSGLAMIHKRIKAFDPDAAPAAMRVTTHNNKAEIINDQKLRALPGPLSTYHAEEHGEEWALEQLNNSCLSPRKLELKIGARVMFTRNETGGLYVNGTMGTVTKATADRIVVTTDKGREIYVAEADWELEFSGGDKATRKQYPLRLAYALTIHKGQGCTFDRISIDLGDAFAPGQAYVALSRARTLEGLNIERWGGARSIITHPTVQKFIRGQYEPEPGAMRIREKKLLEKAREESRR